MYGGCVADCEFGGRGKENEARKKAKEGENIKLEAVDFCSSVTVHTFVV